MGCSSKAPTDELVDDLLEVLCPGGPGAVSNPSVGLLCIQSCMDTCTGASFSMADTHLSDYTDGQRLRLDMLSRHVRFDTHWRSR